MNSSLSVSRADTQRSEALAPTFAPDAPPRGAPFGSAPIPTLTMPTGSVASPRETAQAMADVASPLAAALTSGDSAVMITALASQLRRSQIKLGEVCARGNDQVSRAAFERQMEAYHRAEAAQKEAQTWGLVAKIGAYAGAALAAVVGVASAVFTGGVGTLGCIALAATLVTSASTIGMNLAQDTKLIEGPPPREFGIVMGTVALIGSVCSFGSSSGSLLGVVGQAGQYTSAAAQAANLGADVGVALGMQEPPDWFRYSMAGAGLAGAGASVAGSLGGAGRAASAGSGAIQGLGRSAQQGAEAASHAIDASRGLSGRLLAIGQVAQGTAALTRAGGTLGEAAYTRAADGSHDDAEISRNLRGRLGDETRDVVEAMRGAMAVFDRTARRASQSQRDADLARRAITRNMGRA